MVFAGHDLIAENGTLLAETAPFAGGHAETELDCQRMESERARNTSFEPSTDGYQTVDFSLTLADTALTRFVDPTPFVPGDPQRRAERCELILKMQADGLAKRLEHAHAKTAVIGISGGLDSCLALLVAVRAMKQLRRPTTDVLAVTMPCFGTTRRTRSNAEILCERAGRVTSREIDIADSGATATLPTSARTRACWTSPIENASGPRAHTGADGHRQPHRRPGSGHRRPLRAGAGLGHLQRRPHEHVRRECLGAQNAGAPPRPVRSQTLPPPMRSGPCCWTSWTLPSAPNCCPPKDGEIAQKTEDLVGPYELHDFYPLSCAALRLRARPRSSGWPKLPLQAGPSTPDEVLYKWLHRLLPAVLCPAVQAQLPARRPQDRHA